MNRRRTPARYATRVAAAVALLVLAAGCKKYPYVALLDGVWTGNASDASGNTFPMTNDFTYDDEDERFYGTVDVNGYVYSVDGVTSDKKEVTQMTLLNPLFPTGGTLKKVKVEEEEMSGDYAMPDNGLSGTFKLTLK